MACLMLNLQKHIFGTSERNITPKNISIADFTLTDLLYIYLKHKNPIEETSQTGLRRSETQTCSDSPQLKCCHSNPFGQNAREVKSRACQLMPDRGGINRLQCT